MLSPTRLVPVPVCNQGLSWMCSPTSLPPPLPYFPKTVSQNRPLSTQQPSLLQSPPDKWGSGKKPSSEMPNFPHGL